MASAVLEQTSLSANRRSCTAIRADHLYDNMAPLRETGVQDVPNDSHHESVDPDSTLEASSETCGPPNRSRPHLLEARESLSDLDFKTGPEWSSRPTLEQFLAQETPCWKPPSDACLSKQIYPSSDYALVSKADKIRLSKMQMSDPQMPASAPTSSGSESQSGVPDVFLSHDPKSYYSLISDFYDHVHSRQCRRADVNYPGRCPCQQRGLIGPERQGVPAGWDSWPGRSPRLGFFNTKADNRERVYQSTGEASGPID